VERKVISDEWCGFSIQRAEPWRRAPLRGYTAPGAIRCAWSGPNGASIVIFLQEPGAAISPRVMLNASVQAQKDKLGATVSVETVRAIADMQAMWMVVSGKGNGGRSTEREISKRHNIGWSCRVKAIF